MHTDIQELNEDLFDLDPYHEELPEDQLHRTDDPSVWGLLDVALRRHSEVPQTIYKISGDSASGVLGRRLPNGEYIPNAPSKVGTEFVAGTLHDVKPEPFENTITYVTAWDGAKPSDEFEVVDEDTGEVRRGFEHSRGLLLGDYRIERETA
jgi:hypothetical protein